MRHARCISIWALLPIAALAQKPFIDINGVQNAASRVASSPIAPQMLVSIFGENLASGEATAHVDPLPVRLAGTSVTFNGIAAPLLYVSPGQLNVQVPTGVKGSETASVIVTTAAGASDSMTVNITSGRSLGLFTQDGSGCGPIEAFNVHSDGSMTMNTPQNSLDPATDWGLAIFLTGVGVFPDRRDGVPWQFNPVDNQPTGIPVVVGIPGLSNYQVPLEVSYAGPAPNLVGVDQVNASVPQDNFLIAARVPEGCNVPLAVEDIVSSASQFGSVSIHYGGGRCVDPAPDSLAAVTWQKNAGTDVNYLIASDSVSIQVLSGPNITFPAPPIIGPGQFEVGNLPPQPSFCAASYPSLLNAGPITVSGPGVSPLTLTTTSNPYGFATYQATLAAGSITGGTYQVTGPGTNGIGPINGTAQIPEPVTVTTKLTPGSKISSALTVNWTGGDSRSVVSVQFLVRVAGQHGTFMSAQGVPATAGSVSFTGLLPATFSTPLPYPTGEVEVIVTQAPANPVTFAIPGLTLGGDQTWNYVWDYRGLSN